MKFKITLITLTLLFCGVNDVYSQEWEYSLQYNSADNERFSFYHPLELSNGNICVSSAYYKYRSGYGDFYSANPAVVMLSQDGEELARNSFFRESYTSMSYAPYLFENNGYLYALSTYSPEHDFTCPNYFLNYDNPPTDAKLVLSKLDYDLNLLEIHEHSFPIDTFEVRDLAWEYLPNQHSGNIYLFSAFEDDGDIIGAYFKMVSADYYNPRGHDSLFLFRMNFDGELLNLKGFEYEHQGIWIQSAYRRNQIVKTDSHYILYELCNKLGKHGRVLYFNKEFNHVATKYIRHPDYDNPTIDPFPLMDISVVKTDDDITYLSTTARNIQLPNSYEHDDVRLYKLDDNIENPSEYLTSNNYILRGSISTYDFSPTIRAIDIAPDSSLYFACNYDWEGNPYSSIEHLDKDMDTISTLFYNDLIMSIKSTNDGDLLVNSSTHITKFPASTFGFENIEEVHVHNLHLAVAYPNPGGDVLNIRTGLRNATLQVYDMQGRLVHKQEITDDVTSVDASNWQRGTYVWELGTENGNGSRILESGKWVK